MPLSVFVTVHPEQGNAGGGCLPGTYASASFFGVVMNAKLGMDNRIYFYGSKNILRGLVMLVAILVVGTMGYMIIEGWRLLEALYMTVITITTVGYGEIRTVSEAGRIFTIVVIFLGIGIMAYILGVVARRCSNFS